MQPRIRIGARLAVSAGLLLATCPACLAQPLGSNPATNAGYYEFRAEHDPDGIGKFFMGREIAHVMGHQAADWLERPEREEEEHTQTLVEQLGVKPGDVVADIGAGTG